MKKRVAVYTCITGSYDSVKEFPEYKDSCFDYYLFTNNRQITSDFWRVIFIDDDSGLGNIKLARKIKVLGHPLLEKYDVTVWLDGASYPRKNISVFLEECCDFEKYDLVGFKHTRRDCIYEEALECLRVQKEKPSVVIEQMEKYEKEGYPHHSGLIESTIMARNNRSFILKETMIAWFNEIKQNSCRDQLSFNYVADKCGLSKNLLSMNVFDNQYFGWKKHGLSDRNIASYYVIFGNQEEQCFEGFIKSDYQIDGNNYTASVVFPMDCSELKIEFANFWGIYYDNVKINCPGLESTNMVNWKSYFGRLLFDYGVPTLFLYGSFNKGQKLTVSLDMEVLSESQVYELLTKQNSTLGLLEAENVELKTELERLNSKSLLALAVSRCKRQKCRVVSKILLEVSRRILIMLR